MGCDLIITYLRQLAPFYRIIYNVLFLSTRCLDRHIFDQLMFDSLSMKNAGINHLWPSGIACDRESVCFSDGLAEKFWERPHDELSKNIGFQELYVSSSSNYSIQVPSLYWDIKVDITSHKHALLRGWCTHLVQAVVEHLMKDFALPWVVPRWCLAHLNSGRMIRNITILRRW